MLNNQRVYIYNGLSTSLVMDDRYIWAIAPIAICDSIAGGILVAIPFDATACRDTDTDCSGNCIVHDNWDHDVDSISWYLSYV